MPRILDAPGEARPVAWVLRELARRLGVADFFPWSSESGALDSILDHPSTGHATAAALAAEGGIRALRISHVAHPDLKFPTPSGKIELASGRAAALGLPSLPVAAAAPVPSAYPLTLGQGRTLTHFHGFYDHGRALPSLAKADPEPTLWISPTDAAARGVTDGRAIRIVNERGAMSARARVTDRVPAGTVWMRDGWLGLNDLSSGGRIIPDAAVDTFHAQGFSGGQATFTTRVQVEAAEWS
jgi:anaerobic selenocysteine-containing dehydrogenase